MIKTILVTTSGSATDQNVFATAHMLARPFAAHLRFLHVHMAPISAAAHVPHLEYAMGMAISHTLEGLRQQGNERSTSAREHFEAFCKTQHLPVRETAFCRAQEAMRGIPLALEVVTASFAEVRDDPVGCLLRHAHHSDLVVVGRPRNRDHMPPNLIETLLQGSGRPIVIATDSVPRSAILTVIVAWKETPEAARALGAAMPLLKQAERVWLVTVPERGGPSKEVLEDLSCQLAWHGIDAEVRIMADTGPAETLLALVAQELEPDLLVAGGFGHGPLRECVFGGVTQSLITHADCPVFLLH
jgi:nucleotide-binding universal stress UspA family protein